MARNAVSAALAGGLAALLYWLLVSPTALHSSNAAGQNVIITGASQGIGRALVIEYAKAGAAKIVIASRGEKKLEAVRNEVQALYPNTSVLVVVADLSSQASSVALIEAALAKLDNSLDVLILNHITTARYGTWLRDQQESPEGHTILSDMFHVNVFSYIWCATAAVPALTRSKTGGHIGVVSSLAAHVGVPKTAVYSATKHALHGFFHSFRAELQLLGLSRLGVTLAAIGATDTEGAAAVKTEMSPGLVWDHPRFAAEAIRKGVAAKRREIYHPHHVVYPAIQVNHFLPVFLDSILLRVTQK